MISVFIPAFDAETDDFRLVGGRLVDSEKLRSASSSPALLAHG
jgi:hypothetical protein